MAKYLIVQRGPVEAQLTEAKNLKAAVKKYSAPPGEELTVYRIASGPTYVGVRLQETTVYDIQENAGGSWETEEEE